MTLPLLLWITLAADTPAVPTGLWQQKDEGFVIRIEACGSNLCGVAAGAPPKAKSKSPDVCGSQMLKDFKWNAAKLRWEGQMKPPDLNKPVQSYITSDGSNSLALRAQILFVSKTMYFVRYQGKIGPNCQLEP